MLDILSGFKFGPSVTYRPDPDAPSIYASEEEWAAYRARQNDVNSELMRLANRGPLAQELPSPVEAAGDQVVAENAAAIGKATGDPYYNSRIAMPEDSAKPLPAEGKKHAKQDIINDTYSQMGIKAFTDEKGQLVLTNNPAATDAKSAMKPFGRDAISYNPAQSFIQAPSVPNSVQGLLGSLQKAKDYNEAVGIMAGLNESLGLAASQMEAEAQRFAANKLGIAFLEQSLANNQALDTQAADYVPGIGDSPITMKVRQQLDTARSMADVEAKRFLAQNSSYAALKAAASNADMIFKSKERTQSRVDEVAARAAATQEARAEAKRAEEALIAETLPAYAKERLLMLVPEIGQSDNPMAAMARTVAQRRADKPFQEAISATPEEFPLLAVRGNQYAENAFIAQEAAKTGDSPDMIKAKLRNLQQLTEDPQALRRMITESIPSGTPDRAQAVQAKLLELNKKKLDPEEALKYKNETAALALDFARKTATSMFINSAGDWAARDPVLGAAARKALQVTGSASLTDIMDAYLGDSTGAEAVTKAKQLLSIAEGQALKYQGSAFGMPSIQELNALLSSRMQSKMSMWAKIQQSFANARAEQNQMFLNMLPQSEIYKSPYLQSLAQQTKQQSMDLKAP